MIRRGLIGFLAVLALISWPFLIGDGPVTGSIASPPGRFAGGDGSAEDPYQISTVDELQHIDLDMDAHFILVNSINASSTRMWNSGDGFDPIGVYQSTWFSGTLDGNGYEITGLFIDRGMTESVGLFGVLAPSGVLRDIGLLDCDITGQRTVGALVGADYGQVTRCYSTGRVEGIDKIGGLIGDIQGMTTYCYSACSVTGEQTIGGFVGFNGGGATTIECFATGDVSGDGQVGGFAGHNSRTITDCYATGDVTGGSSVGGLIGYIYNYGSTAPVTHCYSAGSVTGSFYVGGLVGLNDRNGMMMDCFWDNETSGVAIGVGGGYPGTTHGRNTTDMMDNMTFISAGWDYSDVWNQKNGTEYPLIGRFLNPDILSDTIPDATEDVPFEWRIDVHIFRNVPGASDDMYFSSMSDLPDIEIDEEGRIKWTFVNEDVGGHWINVTVDRDGRTDNRNFTFSVINTNDAPVIDTANDLLAIEDELYSVDYYAEDVDPTDDILSWSMDTNAPWLLFDPVGITISGTPENDDVGSCWVFISVSDGNSGSDSKNFTVDVQNVNDPPSIITADKKTATEGEGYLVVYNALDEDPTEDVLEWDLETDAGWLGMDRTSGAFSGMPGDMDTGPFHVNVTVSDGKGGTDHSDFTLVVGNINDAPFITTSPFTTVDEDTNYHIDLNASDVDSEEILTWTLVSGPTWLSLNSSTGEMNGTPENPDVGSFWIQAEVSDIALASDSLEFMLTVKNTNDAPVWITTPLDITIGEGTPFSLSGEAQDVDVGDMIRYGLTMIPPAPPTIATDFFLWSNGLPAGKYQANLTATDGTVTIWHTLTVNVTEKAPPVDNTTTKDTDKDGMPDAWELLYGLDPNDPSDGLGDPDKDGINNRAEYQGKTSPIHDDTVELPDDKTEKDDNTMFYIIIGILWILLLALMLIILLVRKKASPVIEDDTSKEE